MVLKSNNAYGQRLRRGQPPSYQRLQAQAAGQAQSTPTGTDICIACGWGRLLLGHTFADSAQLASTLLAEAPGERDIALYIAAPHQLLAQAPQHLFLDPSDTLRLWFSDYRPSRRAFRGFRIRRVQGQGDWEAINRLYLSRNMLPVDAESITPHAQGGPTYWLAEDSDRHQVIGAVMGLNHLKAYGDPEQGSSLWCLAVDPNCARPGVGEALVRHLVEHFMSRSLNYLDLSVLHDNHQAKKLYGKLGFRSLSTFAVKRKNSINQPLFLGPTPDAGLNPYARIITDEALRRGITVDVEDARHGLFTLSQGGRRIRCHESLSDLTTAISLHLCQDKHLTHQVLERAGLQLPEQQLADTPASDQAFLERHGRLVVKPVNGEQGHGISVDIRSLGELQTAIARARAIDPRVLLESYHPGQDLRILVIGYQVVAAAIRHPASVIGDGHTAIGQLIESQSRRRQAATQGESRIPRDEQTLQLLRSQGYDYDSVLPAGQTLAVRKTANLHTGGTLEDVTERLHPLLADAAIRAARALDIPMVGLDLLVEAADRPGYVIIEANERAGLANHEPQPTAERFLDLLFPLTARSAKESLHP